MKDENKTKAQLINDLATLRQRVAELEKSKVQASQAGEVLWQSQEMYPMLVETMTDGLMVRDKNGLFSYVNDRLCQMFGYSKDELIGHFLTPFLDETNRSIYEDQMVKRRKGIYEPYELSWTRKDGQKITTIMSPKAVFDEDGRFKGSFAVITDITERKRDEEALARQTQELTRSNAELEQFAYVASHDLQEPLRKIQAFGDRLNSKWGDELNDQGRDYLRRMQNAAKRMQNLISDLLTFSRLTSRDQPFTSIDLNEVIKVVSLNLELLIEQTNGHVEAGNLPTIKGNPTQMRQLFQNLIGNALKFHRENVPPVVKIHGKLSKTSKKQPFEKNGDDTFCQIVVEDNGIGMDKKYLDRIFGIFQRLHGRGVYEGTGIGLAICRKIVEHHGGTIMVKSKPEQGTMFIVALPVQHPEKGNEQ